METTLSGPKDCSFEYSDDAKLACVETPDSRARGSGAECTLHIWDSANRRAAHQKRESVN